MAVPKQVPTHRHTRPELNRQCQEIELLASARVPHPTSADQLSPSLSVPSPKGEPRACWHVHPLPTTPGLPTHTPRFLAERLPQACLLSRPHLDSNVLFFPSAKFPCLCHGQWEGRRACLCAYACVRARAGSRCAGMCPCCGGDGLRCHRRLGPEGASLLWPLPTPCLHHPTLPQLLPLSLEFLFPIPSHY